MGSGSAGKLRPVVIVQDDRFDATASVTVCAFTTDPADAPLLRLLIEADDVTGIRESSRLMVDEIATIPRPKLGERIGQLSDDDMIRLSRALVVFLGLAGTRRTCTLHAPTIANSAVQPAPHSGPNCSAR